MEDVGQDDPHTTRAALDHLLSQIDQTTSRVDANLTAESYAVLATLSLSYPWSCLVLDHILLQWPRRSSHQRVGGTAVLLQRQS